MPVAGCGTAPSGRDRENLGWVMQFQTGKDHAWAVLCTRNRLNFADDTADPPGALRSSGEPIDAPDATGCHTRRRFRAVRRCSLIELFETGRFRQARYAPVG